MSPVQPTKNSTPYLPEDYDTHISGVLPFMYLFIRRLSTSQNRCHSARKYGWIPDVEQDPSRVRSLRNSYTKFLLIDPSGGMPDQARKKMLSYPTGRLEFLKACPTQEFSQNLKENPDIITAIQCHHYLSREGRAKATRVCYDLLNEGGVYITFENIRPLTENGITIGKRYRRNFQLSHGNNEKEIQKLLERFDTEYFPITIEEHLNLLRATGFKTVELFWYSYMQAGFYCIK